MQTIDEQQQERIHEARQMLKAAGVFYDVDENDPNEARFAQCINLNDAFFWACSDCESVADEELLELSRLFFTYGWCGVLYWVVENKRGGGFVEFVDVNRKLEFVRQEECIRLEEPDCSKRAYLKRKYTIGIE